MGDLWLWWQTSLRWYVFAMGYIFTTPPDAPSLADAGFAYQMAFSMDTGAPRIFATSASFTQSSMDFMTPPAAATRDCV